MTFRGDFEHRDDLLRAAVTEFSDRGYGNASLNRILDVAGMSKGQLYHHFAGKEGLYLALVEWMIDRKVEWFATHPPQRSDDCVAAIGTQISASLEFAAAHPDVDRLARALLAERGQPIFGKVVSRYGFNPDSALGDLVDHCYAQGRFRADLSPDFVRRAVITVINNMPDLLDLTGPADVGPRIEELLTFLRSGLMWP
ncbi:MAG TPA: TetR/AcrR family transcriptional regulator [Euzebya sp.]|nr:TetR/AcrR family transcriptional regulator [Euzebya sp.]